MIELPLISIPIGVILALIILICIGKRKRMLISLRSKRNLLENWITIYQGDKILNTQCELDIHNAIESIESVIDYIGKNKPESK